MAFTVFLKRLGSVVEGFIALRLGRNTLALISASSCYGGLQHGPILIQLALQTPDDFVPSFQFLLKGQDAAIFHFHFGVLFLQSLLQLSQTTHFRCGYCRSTPPKTQTPCLLFAGRSAAMHHSTRARVSNGTLGLLLLKDETKNTFEVSVELSAKSRRSVIATFPVYEFIINTVVQCKTSLNMLSKTWS